MYQVFLVEDEILERENQRESRIWKTGEFKLCGDAANGQEAWERLQKTDIDILITDIKMPFMDGIALSRLVREHMPHVRIIILSGYSEFSYAQQALGMGVADYIVKPIRSSDLLEALRKVARQIDEKRVREQDMRRLQHQAEQHRSVQIHKLLDDLTLGIFPSASIEERARELDIDLGAKYYIAAIVEYAEPKLLLSHADQLLALDVQKAVQNAAAGKDIFVFHHELQDIRLIFKGDQQDVLAEMTLAMLHKIKDALQQIAPDFKATLSMGGAREELSGIAESFADAKLILSFKYLYSDRDIVVMESSVLDNINQNGMWDLTLNAEKSLIDNLLKFGSRDDVRGVIEKLSEKMRSLQFSLIFYQYTCMDIIKKIQQFLSDIGEDNTNISTQCGDNLLSLSVWLKWSNDIDAFADYLEKTLYHIIDIREHKKNFKYNDIIAEARKYIDGHYCDPVLSLNDVASYVNISNSYFSTLFSQEMGESFIEYLTRKRIERAKEILKTTSMRLTDIAFEVGYQDSNYFSKIFKKLTNESPRQYRG